MPETAQDRGREWERDLARFVGGTLQSGSGNRHYARLDVKGRQIIWSAKYTDAGSLSVSQAIFDDAVSAVQGPGAVDPTILPVIGIKLGDGTMIGALDLGELVGLLKEDAKLIPATAQDNIRKTASTPAILRD